MGRPRKPADRWMPERVYRDKTGYVYRPLKAKAATLLKFKKVNGKIVEDASVKAALYKAYEEYLEERNQPKNNSYWFDLYLASPEFARLKDKQYERYINIVVDPDNLNSRATHNGLRHVFGDMYPQEVRPTHVRKYLDYWNSPRKVVKSNGKVIETEGKPIIANRHRSCLITYFKWVTQYVEGMQGNPAEQTMKFPENIRQVYTSHVDYDALLQAALQSRQKWVYPFWQIAYLCGLRVHEVWNLNMSDIVYEDGKKYLRCVRGKGSRGEMVEISEDLQAAIDFAIALHKPRDAKDLSQIPLVQNTRGQRITQSAINKARYNMMKATGIKDFWNHDLKKKAGTDGKDLKHKTKAMAERYRLKLEKGKATR